MYYNTFFCIFGNYFYFSNKFSYMKKLISLSILVLILTMTSNTGCVKSNGTGVPGITLPNISDFTIQSVSSFIAGGASTISILSSSLGNGAFTVHYDLSGVNSLTGLTATLNLSGGTAS